MYEDGSTEFMRLKDLAPLDKVSDILVYPNPSKDNFNAAIDIKKDDKANIVIFDVSGKEIMNQNLTNGINEINSSKLKAGVYYYHILVKNEVRKSNKLILL